MPRLTYTPEGAEPKVWDFSFGRIKFGERAAIEKLTGLGWQRVQKAFFENHAEVIHAFLWVLLKREIPTLRSVEVDFMDDEIEIDLTDDEAAEALANMKAAPSLSDEQSAAVEVLEARLAVQDAGLVDGEDGSPKEG